MEEYSIITLTTILIWHLTAPHAYSIQNEHWIDSFITQLVKHKA
jgi:hypothetical protein